MVFTMKEMPVINLTCIHLVQLFHFTRMAIIKKENKERVQMLQKLLIYGKYVKNISFQKDSSTGQ